MKKYISYTDYLNKQNRLKLMAQNGLEPYFKKNYLKISLGCSIIIVSILTPFTNVFLIPLGLFIAGVSLKDLDNLKRIIKNKVYKR